MASEEHKKIKRTTKCWNNDSAITSNLFNGMYVRNWKEFRLFFPLLTGNIL